MTTLETLRKALLKEVDRGLPAVFELRRKQFTARIGLCVIIGAVFHPISGVTPAVLWVIVYACLQIFERALTRKSDLTSSPAPFVYVLLLMIMLLSNIVFLLFGLLLAIVGGVWGLICAILLWSGMLLNGVMISGESKSALITSAFFPILAFLLVPLLVIRDGGTPTFAILIDVAALLNVATVMFLWIGVRKLLMNTTRARETARLAFVDSETGLPSRYELTNRIACSKVDTESLLFVAAIGLDRFDQLSNALGHALTVDLVCEIASRLNIACPELKIARLSTSMLGAAYLAKDVKTAKKSMLTLQRAMRSSVILHGTPVDVNVTIGLSQSNDASATLGIAIIDRAVIAVDQGRRNHEAVACFDRASLGDPASSLSLMGEMLLALDRDAMNVHYQPKLDLQTDQIVGVEALVHWEHPQRGMLSPDTFLPMAEETGHIAALTEWVLKRAIEDQRRIAETGYSLAFSVNLSGCLLDDENFARRLLSVASEATGKIIFEVTETSVIKNTEIACRTLSAFRTAGIGISIDDYGTGMSSLGYLKNIPADELKIDKTFVLAITQNNIDAIIVRSVVDLAHSLGLKVVAEGVESKKALDMLIGVNCDMAQGYFISKPISLSAIESLLNAHTSVLMRCFAPREFL